MLSPLATQVTRRTDAITKRKPWGLLMHTTGGGVTAKAARTGRSPIRVALDVYRGMQGVTGGQGDAGYPWGGPGYVIDHDGKLYQIADDDVWTNHCGGPDRAEYLDGSWERHVSPITAMCWRAQWPGVASPAHLFPSRSPNADYIGCEMIPCGDGFGTPTAAGMLFTSAQMATAIALACDLAKRHAFPAGWARTPCLLGHEDVQPIERSQAGGGWDPGFLRPRPCFDFEAVRRAVEAVS